jgi:hypothetical protein
MPACVKLGPAQLASETGCSREKKRGSKPDEEEEEENWRRSSRQAGRQAGARFKATMVPTQSPFFTLLQQMFHATANHFV